MKYIIQYGNGKVSDLIDKLPHDIKELRKGNWVFSESLKGFIGYNLEPEEIITIYKEDILKWPK